MEMSDISYGIIPIRPAGNSWEVFLINQRSHIGNNTYWVFPKGHPEAGEEPTETAARELHEETGFIASEILPEPCFFLEYTFRFEGKKINKTVQYFIGFISEGQPRIDPTEVKDAGWFSLATALDQLDYRGTKDMFTEAREFIKTLKP